MKNMRYGLLLNNTNASVPNACDADVATLPFGGVLGRTKLNNPNNTDTPPAIMNMYVVGSIFNPPMINPATIQPKGAKHPYPWKLLSRVIHLRKSNAV